MGLPLAGVPVARRYWGAAELARPDSVLLGYRSGFEGESFGFDFDLPLLEPLPILRLGTFGLVRFVNHEEVAELLERLRRHLGHSSPETEHFAEVRIHCDGVELGHERAYDFTLCFMEKGTNSDARQSKSGLWDFAVQVDQCDFFITAKEPVDPLIYWCGAVMLDLKIAGLPRPAGPGPACIAGSNEARSRGPASRNGKRPDRGRAVAFASYEVRRILDVRQADDRLAIDDGLAEAEPYGVDPRTGAAEGPFPAERHLTERDRFGLAAQKSFEMTIADDGHLLDDRPDLEGREEDLRGPSSWREAASDDEALTTRFDGGEIGLAPNAALGVVVIVQVSSE